MANLSGKVALVTGSTDGVGRMVAIRLGAMGAEVFVHGRDEKRGGETVAEIEAAGGRAHFLAADLADLDEVRGLARRAWAEDAAPRSSDQQRRHRLGRAERRPADQCGGPRVVLRGQLSCRLRADDCGCCRSSRRARLARIVNVSSAGQQAIDFDDVMLTRGYSGARAYMQSKLAQILFTFDLAERLKGTGVTVNCLHPASYMATTMVREAGVAPWNKVETGAEAILNLATSPALEGRSGLYFDVLDEARANSQAYEAKAREKLRALSFALTGLSPAPD